MDQVPVKNHENWFRDPTSGSLSCSDTSEYDKYMKSYRAEQRKEKEMQTLQNEVSELKSELGDIKSLLLTLVQKDS